MNNLLLYDTSKCTGCRLCEIVCSFKHKGVCGRSASLIRIVSDDKELLNTALFCHHCAKPVCVQLCQFGAIIKETDSGIVGIDLEKCIGCAVCITCPLGGIHIDQENGLAVNCDLCNGDPACVAFCPTGALRYALPTEVHKIEVACSQ